MIKLILGTFISMLVLVSLVVVFYWRDTKYDPSGSDFLIFFGLIPLGITMLVIAPVIIKKWYSSRQEKKEQQQLEEQKRSEQQQEVEEITEEEIESVTLKVYAASSLSALGENEMHLHQLKEGISAELDQKLVNGYGLPILSYRIQEIEDDLEDVESSISNRQKRMTTLIQQQLEQNTETLYQIAEQLKNSAMFYDAKLALEYRMHPAWINPNQEYDDETTEQATVEAVPRLNRLNVHLILPENLFHAWNETEGSELIHHYLTELGIIDQQFDTEYHYWGETTAYQDWIKLLKRIESQDSEVSLLIAIDSEIDQETVDDRTWMSEKYIPSEYISTCCIGNSKVELQNIQVSKSIRITLNSNQAVKTLKHLNLDLSEQFDQEQPFVLVLDDQTDFKQLKKLEQNFADTAIEAHHYIYSKESLGHTQALSKIFSFMLSLQLDEALFAYVYSADHQQTQVVVGTEFA
ncbi:hypothetical protein BEN71_18735 [Acinetobacter wuhouensis]|uniref:hypothetical protein n=1 Tax=Acinetobacter wuhouensis TaxID=1879050 RepID=UPI00083A9CA9|nr:hypothetical protein [Acinetobacter wuhouensis]AXQ23963.1 hypothetical protein BEN71_18735 [Acinetobacter wuhouensis]